MFIRTARWGLSIGEWSYYGWRLGIQVGPWLLLIGRTRP